MSLLVVNTALQVVDWKDSSESPKITTFGLQYDVI